MFGVQGRWHSQGERERVCEREGVLVCVRERENECVCVCVFVRKRERALLQPERDAILTAVGNDRFARGSTPYKSRGGKE